MCRRSCGKWCQCGIEVSEMDVGAESTQQRLVLSHNRQARESTERELEQEQPSLSDGTDPVGSVAGWCLSADDGSLARSEYRAPRGHANSRTPMLINQVHCGKESQFHGRGAKTNGT